MKPRDAFGVIVRSAGLGFIIAGILDLGHVAIELLGLPIRSNYLPALTLTAAAFWIALGLIIIVGASLIVRLIYGADNAN